MKFEISEDTQKKFNIIFGVVLIISNMVGIPLALVSKDTKEVIVANRLFTVSRECEEEILHSPAEVVSDKCIEEVEQSNATINRVLKRLRDARGII